MRLGYFVVLHLLAGLVVWLPHSHAEDLFPYTAFVKDADTAVRSGPGNEFYEADRLGKGELVEVYRHDGGGWCAVRPPAGSFSWVPAENLELTENPMLARVVLTPVKTRVGSVYHDLHDVEYISLRDGEVVEVLGSKHLHDASESKPVKWFKISPPAGEFRWINLKDLQLGAPADLVGADGIPAIAIDHREVAAERAGPPDPIPTFPIGSETTVAPATTSVATNDLAGPADERIAAQAIDKLHVTPVSFQTGTPVDGAIAPEGSVSITPDTVTWRAVADPADPLGAPEPKSFEARYQELNLMLSRAVILDVGAWRLEPIQEQARDLAMVAMAEDELRLVEALRDKIRQFESLQKRSLQLETEKALAATNSVVANRPGSDSSTSQLAITESIPNHLPEFDVDAQLVTEGREMPIILRSSAQPPGPSLSISLRDDQVVDNSIFDATGILIEVVTGRSDFPQFALTDSKGRLIKFVSASQGLDIREYVNKRVGVIGDSTFLRSTNKTIIAARRIVPLQR